MRMIVQITIPVETGNRLAKEGKLGSTVQKVLADIKPEAAYFTAVEGQRGGFIIVDVKDASDIPRIAEPLFLAFNSQISFHPVMTPEDLGKATPHIEAAAQAYK